MSDTPFESWWQTCGERYPARDHKDRARHAYEAGLRSGEGGEKREPETCIHVWRHFSNGARGCLHCSAFKLPSNE